ncbi:MAG: hypothetical protein H0T46_28705 [Deltaproteobacteria bacterium]|nr:hypothetical protein [Deltaproteobacteria bacterium]
MNATCQECKSGRLESATLNASLTPDKTNALLKNFTGAAADVRVRVCLDCGKLDELRADASHLRKMLGEG